jgi:transmembrane 9 superfamily member 2/4
MKESKNCSVLCDNVSVPPIDAKFINDAINDHYLINWIVDGLPAAQDFKDDFTTIGFQLGAKRDDKAILFNHFDLTIDYHEDKGLFRVVGVKVLPRSLKSTSECGKVTPQPLLLSESQDNTIAYTYSVHWSPSKTPWGTRWDHYLNTADTRVHWFSIINSVLVVALLSGMVFMILIRTLSRDIARYNDGDAQEDAQEEFGWKLVHGDVFRPPRHRTLLSVLVGNGAQILLMTLATLGFAAIGVLSPATRGSLPTAMIVFYILFGFVSGYVSTRIYKLLGGEAWRQTVVLTAMLIPGY